MQCSHFSEATKISSGPARCLYGGSWAVLRGPKGAACAACSARVIPPQGKDTETGALVWNWLDESNYAKLLRFPWDGISNAVKIQKRGAKSQVSSPGPCRAEGLFNLPDWKQPGSEPQPPAHSLFSKFPQTLPACPNPRDSHTGEHLPSPNFSSTQPQSDRPTTGRGPPL